MNDKKNPARLGTLVVLRGGRKEVTVSNEKLALALAASKLMHLASREDQELDEDDLEDFGVPKAIKNVRAYFRQRGVLFSSNGRPLLPVGELPACDPKMLSRDVLGLALGAAIALGLEEEEASIWDELWIQLGCHTFTRDRTHTVLPVVLAVDPHTMSISLGRADGPFVRLNDPHLISSLTSLLDEQNPEGWKGATR